MKDIAEDLGVSLMTVSNVLRNRGRIGAELRERILKRARELNYTPDLTARGLATGHTRLIGMVVPDLMHPFFAAIAKTLSMKLRSEGYGLVISSADEDLQLEREEVAALLARRVDALVLATSFPTKKGEVFRMLAKAGTPFVLLDRPIDGLQAPFVGSDNVQIGRVATSHLIQRGYTRIAHIGVAAFTTGKERLRGYRAVLEEAGQKVRNAYISMIHSSDEHGEEAGFAAMSQLLELRTPPDAVFCFNDIIAAGALKAILDQGFTVPKDIAVIGASNLSGFSFWSNMQLSISSVDQDVPLIAETTAQTILNLLNGGSTKPPKQVLLPVKLIARSST